MNLALRCASEFARAVDRDDMEACRAATLLLCDLTDDGKFARPSSTVINAVQVELFRLTVRLARGLAIKLREGGEIVTASELIDQTARILAAEDALLDEEGS